MSWLTVLWSMDAAVCLTLAAINFSVWLSERTKWAYLWFSIGAVAAAAIAVFEFLGMHAKSPEEFGSLLRWAHVPFCILVVSIVWFAHIYLRAGREWLAWLTTGVRTFALVPNFLATYNLNYQTYTGVERVHFLGEDVNVFIGTINPWVVVGRLSSLLLLIFLIDASITVWKRGERLRAVFHGGGMIIFILMAAGESLLLEKHLVHLPYMISFTFFGLILIMAYELSRDMLRASHLVRDLRESEERLILAADVAKLGIWIRDFAKNEIWASDHWRHLFGFAPDERVAFEGIVQRMHPEDREVFHLKLAKALAGEGNYEMEYRLMLPDGGTRWIASRCRIDFNGGGKPRLMRGVSVDITARKQGEMEISRQRSELTHLSRVTMLGELSGSIAHELNQPLTAILYNAQAALSFLKQNPTDIEEVREALEDIVLEDQRAGEVIRRLRLLLTKGEVQHLPVDLNEMVKEIIKLVRVDSVSRGVTVRAELEENLPTAHADRVQLQQVLLNLVMNGCDSMAGDPDSDRWLVVRTGRSENDSLWISVRDHGKGLSPDSLQKAFDPFYTTKSNGMGLGLSICRTIISAHGGKLWAENNDNRGATFNFSLPLNGNAEPQAVV